MTERIKIGLLYSYNENWIGGSYYLQNLICCLNLLEDYMKPLLIIYSTEKELESLKTNTQYPYITFGYTYSFPRLSLGKRIVNKAFAVAAQSRPFKIIKPTLDAVFPVQGYVNLSLDNAQIYIYWVPDFQEHFLPEFFKQEEVETRKNCQRSIVSNKHNPIVFSSEAALSDFKTIYPEAKNNSFVLPFAVTHPAYENIDVTVLKKKFGIAGNYFISPNQFWAHKNHSCIIEAVKLLKDADVKVTIVFTGKEYDYRNPEYTQQLKRRIEELQLQENVLFLGFIDRAEQLQLMKNAEAVIQPSKFEGWSTVVEDSKAMNQYVLASGIPVHKEQLEKNASFFDAESPQQLALLLRDVTMQKPVIEPVDYNINRIKFATDFLQTVSLLKQSGKKISKAKLL